MCLEYLPKTFCNFMDVCTHACTDFIVNVLTELFYCWHYVFFDARTINAKKYFVNYANFRILNVTAVRPTHKSRTWSRLPLKWNSTIS